MLSKYWVGRCFWNLLESYLLCVQIDQFQFRFLFRGRARSYAGVETTNGPLLSFNNIDPHNAGGALNDAMHYGPAGSTGGVIGLMGGHNRGQRTAAGAVDKYLDVKDTVDTLAHLINQHTSKTTATQEACLDWLFKLYSTVPHKVIIIMSRNLISLILSNVYSSLGVLIGPTIFNVYNVKVVADLLWYLNLILKSSWQEDPQKMVCFRCSSVQKTFSPRWFFS